MSNKIYSSPGTYTSEKDLTYSTETVGVTTLGIAGETLKGPAFQPIFIKKYDDFKTTFGGTSPEKFKNTQIVKYELPYIAKSYLTQSNQLFVTRILGLSGYDGGLSYALKCIANYDVETLTSTGETPQTIAFTMSGDTPMVGSITLKSYLSTEYGILPTHISDEIITAWDNSETILYWGVNNAKKINDIKTILNLTDNTTFIDCYNYPTSYTGTDTTENNSWIVANDFTDSIDEYNGISIYIYVNPTGNTFELLVYEDIVYPYIEYHNKLIASLKSRGEYYSDKLEFNITALDEINIASTSTAINTNPKADFNITGTTNSGTTTFDYVVSLDNNKKNYIKNVLGSDAFDKDSLIFCEESYSSILNKGYSEGKIKGLSNTLQKHVDWNNYKTQFQTPTTPFLLSELRGGLPQRLFRLISISDGSTANKEIKLSIYNIDLDKKTFDLGIRSFSDSDKTPAFIEKFSNLSMNETSNNYIGRKIGTIDNKYPLKSSYVIVEVAENAPIDGIPSGFEGYEFRGDAPEITYKTKYYSPGEKMPGSGIISSGDKIKKLYLGFTDIVNGCDYGFDYDLLNFKGKPGTGWNNDNGWTTKTKGFHLDHNAINITDGITDELLFTAPISTGATFIDAAEIARDLNHPYHDIKTRKFTILFSGGFDGWDIYRRTRTNTDGYKIGGTAFTRSNFETPFVNPDTSDLISNSDYYAYLNAIKTFENPEQVVINVLATPGIDILNNTELVRDTIEMVEEKRLDSIYIPTLPDIDMFASSASNTDDWFYANQIADELDAVEIDSNYTAVFYPFIQISDTENNSNVYIPPTAEVVKNIAFTDNVSFPWFATAGYNRGIVNCIRARIALDAESRDTLYTERINPIATFSDIGTVIWGNRNLQIKDSAMNRLNIRRLLLQAKKLIVSVANRLLFDPNDSTVRSQFLSQVNPILDNIRKERGLIDFRVKLQENVEDADRNSMRGQIYIKPTPTLEFIELEFVVTPTSVSFDDV